MTPDRERLKAAIDLRAAGLGLFLREVASRAHMDGSNLYRIRTGENELTTSACIAIEEALQWERGSIQAILDGGEPTPAEGAATPATTRAESGSQEPADELPIPIRALLQFGTLVGGETFTVNLGGEEVKIGVFATSRSDMEKLVDQYNRLGEVTGQVKRTFESGQDQSSPDSRGGAEEG